METEVDIDVEVRMLPGLGVTPAGALSRRLFFLMNLELTTGEEALFCRRFLLLKAAFFSWSKNRGFSVFLLLLLDKELVWKIEVEGMVAKWLEKNSEGGVVEVAKKLFLLPR